MPLPPFTTSLLELAEHGVSHSPGQEPLTAGPLTAGPRNSNTNQVDPRVVQQAIASTTPIASTVSTVPTVPTVPAIDTDIVRILRKVCPRMLTITKERSDIEGSADPQTQGKTPEIVQALTELSYLITDELGRAHHL